MNAFVTWLQGLIRPFKPWVTVKPWEQGVRVRFGKHVHLLQAGMHWKIPFFDSVTVLPVRVRVVSVPTQTAMTKDGKAVTVAMAMQYQIEDLLAVFGQVHHPEQTLMYWAQGAAGGYMRDSNSGEITMQAIAAHVYDELINDVTGMGLGAFRVFVTDFAVVRTFRLIQDTRWVDTAAIESLGHEG